MRVLRARGGFLMNDPLKKPPLPPTVDEQSTPAPQDTAVAGDGVPDQSAFVLSLPSDPLQPPSGASPGDDKSGPSPLRFGKFELLAELGAGGMGRVFKARDTNLDRIVALKVLKNSILPDPDEIKRFHREAKAESRVEHPNIIPVYEFGEIRGLPYFAMQLADGGNLVTWTKENGRDPQRIVAIMEKVSRAVSYAHEKGVIHRDLKPGNILMTKDGEPLLADFGLAKFIDESVNITDSEAVLGTLPYMSPEYVTGDKSADPKKSDLWALGVILYELLTGKLPFESQQRIALFQKIANSSHKSPRSVNTTLDKGLERIINRCLQKVPEDRYASVSALADALADWQKGEIAKDYIREWFKRQGRKIKRHPKIVAATLLSLVLIGLSINWAVDYFDEYKAIRPAMAALKRGEKVTLIGGLGASPSYFRDVLGKSEGHPPLRPECGYEFRSLASVCLIELMPAPLPSSYSFEAELKHIGGTDTGCIGVYCAHLTEPTDKKAHAYFSFLFSDLSTSKSQFASRNGERTAHCALCL